MSYYYLKLTNRSGDVTRKDQDVKTSRKEARSAAYSYMVL